MPPKPTCKVVKREGQRGARIDPKGCKVRTTKDAQGNKRQYNKQGQEKFKIIELRFGGHGVNSRIMSFYWLLRRRVKYGVARETNS